LYPPSRRQQDAETARRLTSNAKHKRGRETDKNLLLTGDNQFDCRCPVLGLGKTRVPPDFWKAEPAIRSQFEIRPLCVAAALNLAMLDSSASDRP
jgi:hypothetical protein